MESAPAFIGFANLSQATVIFANMIQSHLQENRPMDLPSEATHDFENSRHTQGQASLCLSPAVNDGSGSSQSREHRTSICLESQSDIAGVATECYQSARCGPRPFWIGVDQAGRFQDSSSRCFDEQSRRCFCSGGLETIKVLYGLAPAFGTLFSNLYPHYRRGWLLQSGGFQRSIAAGPKRNDVPGRTSLYSCSPPRWKGE